MNDFIANLKREAAANPLLAVGVGAALLTAASKLIDAAGSVKSKNAFAKRTENALKKNR